MKITESSKEVQAVSAKDLVKGEIYKIRGVPNKIYICVEDKYENKGVSELSIGTYSPFALIRQDVCWVHQPKAELII